jgi:hypothetical protein
LGWLDNFSPPIRGAEVWALSREELVALRREDVDLGVMEEW